MLPNLTSVVIYSSRKCALEDVLKTPVLKISVTEFNVKEVPVCRVAIFSNEVLPQIYFLGMYEIFNINNSSNLDY